MEILTQGFDHVEFVVNDVRPMEKTFQRMGFEKIGERTLPSQKTKTLAYAQGQVRILLTQATPDATPADRAKSHALKFLSDHAEGICVLALEVKDAVAAYQQAIQRGARSAREPQKFQTQEGTVVRAEIWTPASVRYAFIERHAPQGPRSSALFDEGLVVSRIQSPSPCGILSIDHLTNNVGMGEMKAWVEFYKKVFGFSVTRHFDIRTGKTGLISDVIESSDRFIKVPINEPTEKASQVQEFVDRMKGPGVQHLALLTTDIQDSLQTFRKQGFKFLKVPHTYYESVPTRVPGVTENLGVLEDLGVLLDGDDTGYLLQIFSEEILGPFFFEYIQRKGNQGFGEGNFRALFEAIERDQVKRGVLK